MSKIQVNEIVNHFDNGAPDCPKGLTITGVESSVGIGTTNPQRILHLYTSDNTPLLLQSPDTLVDIVATDSGGSTRIRNTDGELRFFTGGDGDSINANNATTKVAITTTGNLEVYDGNLVFSTSGTGIDFSATSDGSGTVDSELLDDYEEGTWTPAYDTGTTSSSAISYSNQTGGSYIKIGRAVYICGRVRTDSSQSLDGTGNIILTGLPFPISDGFDGDSNTQDTSAVISLQQVDGWNESPLVMLAQGGFNYLFLYNGSDLTEPIVIADFDTTGINRMRFSGFYFTDS